MVYIFIIKRKGLMKNEINDIEAYIQALLDITDNNRYASVKIVCDDIQVKEQRESSLFN